MPSTVTLSKCKLRNSRFVPVRPAEVRSFEWPELVAHFVGPCSDPHTKKTRLHLLRRLRPGLYMGKKVDGRVPGEFPFLLLNEGRGNDFSWILKRNPLFFTQVRESWQVVATQWEGSVEHLGVIKQ